MMLHIGAGRSNNHQIIFELFGYDTFCKNLQHKKFRANLEVSQVLITYVTNGGKARMMLHIGAGHSNNHQIIFEFLDRTYFAKICSTKEISSKFGGIRCINHLHYKWGGRLG